MGRISMKEKLIFSFSLFNEQSLNLFVFKNLKTKQKENVLLLFKKKKFKTDINFFL